MLKMWLRNMALMFSGGVTKNEYGFSRHGTDLSGYILQCDLHDIGSGF